MLVTNQSPLVMNRYIKSLDGIRGFGIFFVLFYHYLRLNDHDWTTFGFSWIWIQMFFVQSGYLITAILLDSKHQSLSDYMGRFYWRRILRIFPVYFAYLLVFTITYVIFNMPDDFFQRAPYLFTFTYNYTRLIPEIDFNSVFFVHFWSLAVEEQFYLVWPVIVYFLSLKQLRSLIIFLIFAIPVFRFWWGGYVLTGLGFSPEMTGEIIYAFTLSQFDAFAFGAAIPVFNLPKVIQQPGKWSLIAVLVTLGFGFINYLALQDVYPDISITSLGISVAMIDNYQHVWSYTLINILFTVVIVYLISENYRGIFNNTVLVNIGKIVYGLYIFHFAILFVMSRLNAKFIHSFPVSFIIGCLLCYGVAYVSYYYFEKKFLALKDYWKSRKQAKVEQG